MDANDPRHGTTRQSRWMVVAYCTCLHCEASRANRRRQHKERGMGKVRRVSTRLVNRRLRELTAEGWLQSDIARVSGVGRATISEALGGISTTMSVENAAAIVGITGRPNSTTFVSAVGTRRRIEALVALGWLSTEVCLRAGLSQQFLPDLMHREQATVTADTASAVAAVYDDLSMTVPPMTPHRRRSKTLAAKHGWAPPLAWNDIDTDTTAEGSCTTEGCTNKLVRNGLCDKHYRATTVKTGRQDYHDAIDPIVVERLLAGQTVTSTRAEKNEAMRRWLADGRSERSLCEIHGWKDNRYGKAAA